jgi:LacI family transcriptional regulator
VVSLDEDVSFDTQNIIRSLEKTMSNAGGSVLFLPRRKADGRLASVREVVGDLVAKGAQAVAILSYNEPEVPFDDVEGLIPNAVVPTVHVSPVRADRPVWNVYYDSVDAGFQATSHLIECGCKSFAYLACEHTEWSDERLLGMQSALNRTRIGAGDLRIRFEPRDANSDPWRVDAGERAALAIFSEFVPDGIVATNDHMAHGVLIAAEKLGLKAGDDFLLVAFDDSEVAQSLGISSMRSPVEEMGANGAFLAIRALEGDTVCQKVSLNSHLIVRATTIWNLDRHNA